MNDMPPPARAVSKPLLAGLIVVVVIVGVTMAWRQRPGVGAEDSVAPASAASAANPRMANPAAAPRPRTPPSMAERREHRKAAQVEQERKGRAFHDTLAARYAAEPVDAAWAGAKEAKLLAASASDEIRRIDALPANYRASCRSTVCRIGADFPNRGAVQDWLTLFSTGVGAELPNEAYVVSQNPDGSFHLEVMGLARK